MEIPGQHVPKLKTSRVLPEKFKDGLIIAVDSYPEDEEYHIVVRGKYLGSFKFLEAQREVAKLLASENRARFFLGYCESFGAAGMVLKTGEMYGDRWNLSSLLPKKIWSQLKNLWGWEKMTGMRRYEYDR